MLQRLRQLEIIGLRMKGLILNARKLSIIRKQSNRFRRDNWRIWSKRLARSG